MKQIDISDTLYVTTSQLGVTIANISFSGANSLADVANMVRRATTGHRGMVNVCLRNGSRGWSHRLNLYI